MDSVFSLAGFMLMFAAMVAALVAVVILVSCGLKKDRGPLPFALLLCLLAVALFLCGYWMVYR